MDTEKKSGEQRTDQPKPDIGEIVGDLVVSGATILAHSAAEAVVKRVKKAADRDQVCRQRHKKGRASASSLSQRGLQYRPTLIGAIWRQAGFLRTHLKIGPRPLRGPFAASNQSR